MTEDQKQETLKILARVKVELEEVERIISVIENDPFFKFMKIIFHPIKFLKRIK